MSRPNIIMFLVDSWDGRKMGYLADSSVLTPNADRLAGEATVFESTYCTTPLCCPCRASIWSGQFPHHCEAWNNHKGREEDAPTFETELSRAGYATQIIGTTDFRSGGHSLGARVSSWIRASGIPIVLSGPRTSVQPGGEERTNTPDWEFVDEAAQWLKRYDGNEPFFLSVGIRLPHPYRTTSEHWISQINPDLLALPARDSNDHPVMEFVRSARGCEEEFAAEEMIALRRRYTAMIAEADALLGELVAAVKAAGLWDSTYFIFGGDHGEMNMEHNMVFKSTMYEPSARVPLMISGPDAQKSAVVKELTSTVDLYPTMMDMAGISPQQQLDGHSLMAAIARGQSERPDWVMSQYHANDQQTGSFMLRQGQWKYVAYPGYQPQLFNVDDDPDEIRNLSREAGNLVEDMDATLRAIIDYPAVDAQVKEYDNAAFREWRGSLSDAEYQAAMAKMIPGWGDTHEERIRAWLDE